MRKRRQLLLSLFVLLIGYMIHGSFIEFFNPDTVNEKDDISILTFNSLGSRGLHWSKNPEIGTQIVDFVTRQNSDIVSFQEFKSSDLKKYSQYPYTFVNYSRPKEKRVVQAILSKYPIVNQGSLKFPETLNNAIFADIVIHSDTIRVYNIHLESFKFRLGAIKREEPKRLLGRLNESFKKQQEQALLIERHKHANSYKTIICGDFNNTQFSSVYNTIKGSMGDSFQERGSGMGNTYNFRFLPFRIDFILMDESMEIITHKNFKVRLSDHEPIMASFRLKGQ
ncbi:MAG: endonuclease/exonuclease/phosphatase family protein [Flavobacteriaceae bacterium]